MMDILLRLIGAFYAVAGYVVVRQALTSRLLDHAIGAISGEKPKPIENVQTLWHLGTAVIVFASGVALMVLLEAAVWAFALGTVCQALYLIWLAPHYFDPVDPPEPKGRRQSVNAFVVYAAATALVIWAALTGKLLQWQDAHPVLLAAAATAIITHAGYAAWMYARPLGSKHGECRHSGSTRPLDPSRLWRVKVMADYHAHPLWAMDEDMYGDFSPWSLGLSAELCSDLDAWADAYTQSFDDDDPATSRWTEAQQTSHEEEGHLLARRLKQERPDLMVYVFDRTIGVREVHA